MKKLFTLSIFLLYTLIFCQTEYQRVWGTYAGPAGTKLQNSLTVGGLLTDSHGNIYTPGYVEKHSYYNESYYNQFITANGTPFDMNSQTSPTYNYYSTVFSPIGNQTYASYSPSIHSTQLQAIDSQNNQFRLESSNNPIPSSTSAGTWFSSDPDPMSTRHSALSKYSESGNLLWTTYLPGEDRIYTLTDEGGYIYIIGTTYIDQGISTPGAIQQNYETTGNVTQNSNGYMVKLNPDGQLIWGTYYPAYIYNVCYYNNNLYILTGPDTNISNTGLASPGAFQSTKSHYSIAKINSNTGSREWSTYYGPTGSGLIYTAVGLKANATGVYITGDDYNFNGASYFGTTESFKPQSTAGNLDLYLSKFSLSGNREWSTYFGGDGDESYLMTSTSDPIAVVGNFIFITGASFGGTTNLATPGAFLDTPDQTGSNTNYFFTQFTSGGRNNWTSYYGGSAYDSSLAPSINIAAPDINTFYLYGTTTSTTGISTPQAHQTQPVNPMFNLPTGFLAKFSRLNPLATHETGNKTDLVLYDNPNNGNFSLKGDILEKEKCEIHIYDFSGRSLYSQKLPLQKIVSFNLQYKLGVGNYLLEVKTTRHEKVKTFKLTVK